VILCSGKVAFDIEAKLEEAGTLKDSIKVVRIEEIAPFPISCIRDHLKGAHKAIWVQEESLNQGAFQFAKLHVDRVLAEMGLAPMAYIGRKSVHSFCTGASSDHKKENDKLWKQFE
jgi:2-oxoglutarate dehydrogenase E1 component